MLGAHVSTAGGLARAPEHGRALAAEAIQVFTRNQVQWKGRPVGKREAASFRTAVASSGVGTVLAHGSYLVNLGSPFPAPLRRSRAAFFADMVRCHSLGIPYLIFHPGAHMGAGEKAGLATVARSLDHLLERGAALDVMPLLEVTAGQGSCLGNRFEHLAEVFGRLCEPERVGVCLDTCHLYAAGYDIATPGGYERTLAELDRRVGLDRVRALHLNDSKLGLGSRRDRHESIGRGQLGLETFRRVVRDPRLRTVPKVLETPGPLSRWASELRLLRRLRDGD
jgi:deoxyribonuclease IV